MNRKAQLLTLDLLLALIPMTLVLGMSANAISGISTQSMEYISTYSMHRRAADFMDILVKSPGDPPNWDEILNTSVNGVANLDPDNGRVIANYVSARKLYNINTTEMERVLGTTSYNLTLYIENPELFENFTDFALPTFGVSVPTNPRELVAVERLVVADNLLQISEDAPEGFADISNIGGGRKVTCFDTALALTQDEINYFQFWMFMEFECPGSKCPTSLVFSLNDDCNSDKCNRLFTTADVPFDNSFNLWPTNNGTTFDNKSDCSGTDRTVEYWINKTSDSPGHYVVYVKVPKEFLVAGIQSIYIDVRGVESLSTGFVATAPQEVTRETLIEYFASKDKYKDQKSKLVLRLWR